MRLSQRLQAILEWVEPCGTAADIGCDHGRLSAELLLSGRAERVIAADISRPSLEKAVRLGRELGLEGRLETRAGDGLSVLKRGEADCIVMAGMGAMLMATLLEREEETAKAAGQLVLSPNNYEERLRAYLVGNGFLIEKERYLFEAGHYYPILSVHAGQAEPYSPAELLLGRAERSQGGREAYCSYKKETLRGIVRAAALGGGRAEEALEVLGILEEETYDNGKTI